MKLNKLYIAFLMIAMSLVWGCSDYEDTVKPSPTKLEGCQGVYFPTSNKALFELEPNDAKEITLTVSRVAKTGSVEVPLTVETNTEDVFDVPAKVTFAAGETEASFKVTFPDAGEGVAYQLKIAVVGDEFVNPYGSAKSYVSTAISRVKWEKLDDPFIYVDGAFSALFGVSSYPMYVEVEEAKLEGSMRYRFKNAYDVPTGDADADGIFDGYPYNDPGDFDEANDYYTIIEISDPKGVSGDAVMVGHEIGVAWSDYGMISIGSLPDKPGKVKNGTITFAEGDLFFSMANYNDGAAYGSGAPTVIYTTKEAFIKANLKIEDYNAVEYEIVAGEVSEYWSKGLNDNWSQTIAKAVDADPENEASEYKDLYYLANLYTEDSGLGLAFYYPEGGKVLIPESQPTGMQVYGEDVFVSQSKDIKSTVVVTKKGVTEYTLGLKFHYEDGTVVGEFAELFYHAKSMPSYEVSDFVGSYVMTGEALLQNRDNANMEVEITEGTEANTLVITGIDVTDKVVATFDPATSLMSIAPQAVADVSYQGTFVDATFLTFDGQSESTTAKIDMKLNMGGQIVLAPATEAIGYLIYTADLGGYFDGFALIEFSPVEGSKAAATSSYVMSPEVQSAISWSEETPAQPGHNFKVQGKINPKSLNNEAVPVIF